MWKENVWNLFATVSKLRSLKNNRNIESKIKLWLVYNMLTTAYFVRGVPTKIVIVAPPCGISTKSVFTLTSVGCTKLWKERKCDRKKVFVSLSYFTFFLISPPLLPSFCPHILGRIFFCKVEYLRSTLNKTREINPYYIFIYLFTYTRQLLFLH